MRSAIPYYILTLLDRHGSVHIPGIGHLVREVTKARVDDARHTVFPPATQVEFSDNTDEENDVLSAFIAYRAGVQSETSRKAVTEFAEQILTALESQDTIHIEHFGTFTRKDGHVHLDPDNATVNLRYEGLEPVPIPAQTTVQSSEPEPVEDIKSQVAVPEAVSDPAVAKPPEETKPAPAKSRKRRLPLFIPLLLLLFIVICILAYLQYRSTDLGAPAATTADTTAQHVPGFAHTNEHKTDTMPAELAPVPAPVNNDTFEAETSATDSTQRATQAAGDSVQKESSDPTSSGAQEHDSVSTAQDNSLPEVDSTTEGMSAAADVPNGINDDTQVSSPTEQVPSDSKSMSTCVVVVGAFGVENNVFRMEKRLSAMGFEVVKIPAGRLMQVGVPVTCGSVDARQKLQELRRSVEAGAWILKR